MHQQEVACHVAHVLHDGARLVALGIALRSAHVALRVARVVAIPMRDWGAGHRALEHVRGLHQAHCRQVAAIAPAIDAHPRSIGQALRHAPLNARGLILDLDVAHVVLEGAFELVPSSPAPAVVHLQDEAASAPHRLRPEVDRHPPRVADELDVWTAVARHDRRVGSRAVLGGIWLVDRSLQRHLAVCRRERHKFRRVQIQLVDQRILVAEDGGDLLAVAKRSQRRGGGLVHRAVHIHKGLALGVDHHAVRALLCGDSFRLASCEGHAVEVATHPALLACAREVHQAAILVDGLHALHDKGAAGEGPQVAGLRLVDVQLPEPCALARPKQLAGLANGLQHVVDVDPDVRLLCPQHLRTSSCRVQPEHCQLGLLPVHHLHGQGAIWQPLHACQVEVPAERPGQVELLRSRHPIVGPRRGLVR
mmetsp:Transcript_56208/g.182415  ORF Transcript_56208/g.182415 Transcript_56208/m.182415 type:complete len:421 (+) Transcript_56208:323-1585(+)